MATWTTPVLAKRPRNPRWFTTLLWTLMLLSSLGIAAYGVRYFLGSVADDHFRRHLLLLQFHIAGGIGALLAGPWQFSQRLRARALTFHRWLGRFYLLSVGMGSVAGFGSAIFSAEGPATHAGFGVLAVLWFVTALQAYRTVLRGEIELHRQWMTRNFALTLAAVTLRIELPFMLAALHWPFHRSYVIVAWLCWVPNLLVAEWMVSRSR